VAKNLLEKNLKYAHFIISVELECVTSSSDKNKAKLSLKAMTLGFFSPLELENNPSPLSS
jgi:hypothetical protein